METLITVINFLFLGLVILTPILLFVILKKLNTKYFSVFYFLMGGVVTGVIICFLSWWIDQSNCILLEYYGYNMYGMNIAESYDKVLPENLERVKEIEISTMGIGWPLKALVGFIIFSPYLVVIFLGARIIERIRK